jgi:small nuclear ribonucleoprotein (snRNP)-like protein
MNEADRLAAFVGREVVLDTDSIHLYAGTLQAVDEYFYELVDADVHDTTTTSTTRDVYIMNLRKFGIKKNRNRVLIRRDRVVSLACLEDVIVY